MLLDADAMLAELDAPQLLLHGETYTARHLSFEEQVRLMGTLDKLSSAEKRNDFAGMQRQLRVILDRFFPPPKRRWLGPRAPTVADRVLALPPAVASKIVLDFLKSLRSAPLGENANTPSAMGPETSGAGNGAT